MTGEHLNGRRYEPLSAVEAAGFVAMMAPFVGAAVTLEYLDAYMMAAAVGRAWWIIELGVAAFFGIGAFWMVLAYRRPAMVAAFVIGCLIVVAVVLAPWQPRKRFVMDLFSIHAGMTVEEAQSIMAGYEPRGDESWVGPCPYGRNPGGPGDRSIGFGWNATDGRYNADTGDITFLKGRVVNVEFSPD